MPNYFCIRVLNLMKQEKTRRVTRLQAICFLQHMLGIFKMDMWLASFQVPTSYLEAVPKNIGDALLEKLISVTSSNVLFNTYSDEARRQAT
ncbi:hypothetical protein RHSIM_Rhsim02G0064500 [Rhododendron simsii]|uniref:Uncharacterized protein n=1 Tax=Rhododendron simsii TaxID=118357 RepID=A0A834LXP7_RHOSS|nr:hypothetical protein RHSIM_Rhsim02G0064500 [Rhododendron simsii]